MLIRIYILILKPILFLMLIAHLQNTKHTFIMMQSKKNHEAESEEENELKSSNNQFDEDRQGELSH